MAQAAISFSHFGIHVTDLPLMEEFYTRVIGLVVTDRGPLRDGSTLAFLSRDPDEHHQMVLAQTEAICRSRPGFVSRAEWRTAVAKRMASA